MASANEHSPAQKKSKKKKQRQKKTQAIKEQFRETTLNADQQGSQKIGAEDAKYPASENVITSNHLPHNEAIARNLFRLPRQIRTALKYLAAAVVGNQVSRQLDPLADTALETAKSKLSAVVDPVGDSMAALTGGTDPTESQDQSAGNVERLRYKSFDVEIVETNQDVEIWFNGDKLRSEMSEKNGPNRFFTWLLPYQEFKSAEAMAKELVDHHELGTIVLTDKRQTSKGDDTVAS
jgi:hypothetical protein